MQKQISNIELAAIRVMRNFLMKNGRMPSVRELMKEMSYKSPRSASMIFQGLQEKGVVNKRSDGTFQLVQYEVAADESIRAQTVKVPLLGRVACGIPLLAEENVEAEISISVKLMNPPHQHFLLYAKGDSMNLRDINDGDMLLIKQQESAEDGDIVVALIDDEATVKELKINTSNVVLMPRSTNKNHTPIILSRDFKVQGVVVDIIPGI